MGLAGWLRRKFSKKRDDVFETVPEPVKKKPSAPRTFACATCGASITSVDRFVCRYCNIEHCEKHRLPEDHDCAGLKKSDIPNSRIKN